MKKIFVIILIFVGIGIICSFVAAMISKTSEVNERMEIETKEKQHKDSVARVEFIKDSIDKAARNAEIISDLKTLFKETGDDFSEKVWIEPKSAPRYRNQNGVYCYFSKEKSSSTPENFRFVYQYYADDWLFIDNMIFNIDGENYQIFPNMKTDCGNGGKIWEWCDSAVGYGYGITQEFISKIANAESVKVKMNGSNYYNTRTLTKEQIKSIKNTYEYYLALGGSFPID